MVELNTMVGRLDVNEDLGKAYGVLDDIEKVWRSASFVVRCSFGQSRLLKLTLSGYVKGRS